MVDHPLFIIQIKMADVSLLNDNRVCRVIELPFKSEISAIVSKNNLTGF